MPFDHAHLETRGFCTSISIVQYLRLCWLCFVISNPQRPCQQPKKRHSMIPTVTQSANAAVLRAVHAKWPGKQKAYTAFTAEQRATIRKYAFKYGNAAVLNKFKAVFEGGQLGVSTVHCFKTRYIEELRKAKISGAIVPDVRSIVSRK